MARFGSTVAFVVGSKRYKAGQTFADTQGNAVPGDVVWAQVGLSASMSPGLIPLDASAITIKGGSRFTTTQVPPIDGVNSIEG